MIPPAALENVARIAVAVLLNSLWEDAILVAAVWFLLRRFCKPLPRARFQTREHDSLSLDDCVMLSLAKHDPKH